MGVCSSNKSNENKKNNNQVHNNNNKIESQIKKMEKNQMTITKIKNRKTK